MEEQVKSSYPLNMSWGLAAPDVRLRISGDEKQGDM